MIPNPPPDPERDQRLRAIIEVENLPSIQQSVTGFNGREHRVYYLRGVAGKLYRCAFCAGDIALGDEHVVERSLRQEGGYDHHHMDQVCFTQKILPSLGRVAIIDASETTPRKLNKRARDNRRELRRNRIR